MEFPPAVVQGIEAYDRTAGVVELRLTVGLRKIDGEWIVLHEHHSVPTVEKRLLG
jgi:hypothetical protein